MVGGSGRVRWFVGHRVKSLTIFVNIGSSCSMLALGTSWSTCVYIIRGLIFFRYINAFGVYQDYYIRHYLTKSTPSEIGFVVAMLQISLMLKKFSSWIGGTQIFLNFSCGVFVGRLFDRGQLCVVWFHLSLLGAD